MRCQICREPEVTVSRCSSCGKAVCAMCSELNALDRILCTGCSAEVLGEQILTAMSMSADELQTAIDAEGE